jgi:GTP pyrophosphokinase
LIPLTDILDGIRGYHATADTELVNRAYVYAARMHQGQMRKSGDAYFVHPVNVAQVITELHLDTSSVCAALLHDVIEDTEADREDIARQFGEEIAFLVEGVTKLGKLNFGNREDRQAESFRKMLLAMARDIRVLLVKLADRLDNMRTLHYMSPDAQERISHETMDVYAPLAGRLGIQWLKDELEDLSFKYLYPEQYAQVARKLAKESRGADKYLNKVVREMKQALEDEGLEDVTVTGRLKRPFSIYRKMREQQCEFELIQDVIAFRIVVSRLADCYGALGVVHSRWTPVPGRFKDYIALPKSNMYQSLHTTVIGPEQRRIEVQIRTEDMHRTADMGIAAHWSYREKHRGLTERETAHFQWLRRLMEFEKEAIDPAEFFDGVKSDLFADEVYVFTPKGDVRTFPRGSTPIDLAYAIHSEIGDHCEGARVNGVGVPLDYVLHNGDTVEILTSPRQEPSNEWLAFARTSRARSRIRSVTRAQEHRRSEHLGRDLLEREVRKRNLSFGRLLKSGELERVAKELSIENVDELFAQIGYGRLEAAQIADTALGPSGSDGARALRPGLLEKTVDVVARRTAQQGIELGESNDVLVRYSRCCNPVPGDAVTGWLTRGRGVAVHRRGCERSLELEPERRVDCRWARGTKLALPTTLRVITADRPGILASLSRQFNDEGVNINEATCKASVNGRAHNTFNFQIGDLGKLRALMRSLARLDGVYEVDRQ